MNAPNISDVMRDKYVTSWALVMQPQLQALAALDRREQVDSLRVTLEQLLWKYCRALEQIADHSQQLAQDAMMHSLPRTMVIK